MNNFNFYNPVKILFGKGKIAEISKNIPKNANILITYGGGSIKKNGILEQVKTALKGFSYFEFAGIEPNPSFETLMKAVEIVKDKNIDFLLAVGGGSVIDGTKFIAAASKYKGECAYDICSKQASITEAIPLATVLTLPATGSEMNANAVVTRRETKEKFAFYSSLIMPQFSVLDPEATYSLPKRQLANGVVDAFIHVLEQYLTYNTNSPVQDYMAEGILKTLIKEGKMPLSMDVPDYDNRANIMWAATMALNGLLSCGVVTDWSTHKIGHELTALHGVDHAASLAIVLPAVIDIVRVERKEKLLQYARNVWDISGKDENIIIDILIEKTNSFFNSLGIKSRLSDYNISVTDVDFIVKRFEGRDTNSIGNLTDVKVTNLRNILMSRL
ncbi:MAG: iron-containing alcohol dehydrogenase [Marinifilaceae bacterium]